MKELVIKNSIFENNEFKIKQKNESYEEIVCRKVNKLISQLKSFKLTHPEFKIQIDDVIERLDNIKAEDIISCKLKDLIAFTVVTDSPSKSFFIQKDFIAENRQTIRFYSGIEECRFCHAEQAIERSKEYEEQTSIV